MSVTVQTLISDRTARFKSRIAMMETLRLRCKNVLKKVSVQNKNPVFIGKNLVLAKSYLKNLVYTCNFLKVHESATV